MLITRSDDGYFGLRRSPRWSLRRRSVFPFVEAVEEHWVTEDGDPVAP